MIASPPINLGSFGDVKGRTAKLVYILTLSPNVEKIIVSVSTVTTATPLEIDDNCTQEKSHRSNKQLCAESQAAQGQLPPLPAIRKLVRRQWVRVQAPPPMPASLEHLIIPADSE